MSIPVADPVVAVLPPGWDIAANLTPQSLIDERRARANGRRAIWLVVIVMLLVVAGYGWAFYKVHQANNSLSSAVREGKSLYTKGNQYNDVVQIEGSIASVKAQLAQVMVNDVNAAQIVDTVLQAAPSGIVVSTIKVALTPDGSAAATTGGQNVSLDTTGETHIGTLILQGTGVSLDNASAFVAALANIPGIVDVTPVSNVTQQTGGTEYTVDANLTGALLSHQYALATNGGK